MLNELYFMTTFIIRPHFLGPMGGLKIERPLYMFRQPQTLRFCMQMSLRSLTKRCCVMVFCTITIPILVSGHDENQVAVSLGYTTHIVQMISEFLDVPLRYPMEHLGSRSQIRDHIIDKLSDKEREYVHSLCLCLKKVE